MARMIVRRGDIERYEVLYKAFNARCPVSWDRRRLERRKDGHPAPGDERRARERRGQPPPSWTVLGFVVTG